MTATLGFTLLGERGKESGQVLVGGENLDRQKEGGAGHMGENVITGGKWAGWSVGWRAEELIPGLEKSRG